MYFTVVLAKFKTHLKYNLSEILIIHKSYIKNSIKRYVTPRHIKCIYSLQTTSVILMGNLSKAVSPLRYSSLDLLRTFSFVLKEAFVQLKQHDFLNSSSAVESPIKIIKSKSKSSLPNSRKSLDFNSLPPNILSGAMDTLLYNNEEHFSQPIKSFINHNPNEYLETLQSNLSEIPAHSNEINSENTALSLPDNHHQSFEHFNNSMIFNNNTTLHLGDSGLQKNPLNFDSMINNSCENIQGNQKLYEFFLMVANDDNSIILKTVLEYVKRIDSRLYKIEEDLKHGNQNIMQQKPLNDEFVSLFPMKESSEITNVDLRLKNTMNCSWCGLQRNFALQHLKMFSLMNGVCKTIFNDCTDSMFEELVKEWFKYGKQRYFRENKNNNVASNLNASIYYIEYTKYLNFELLKRKTKAPETMSKRHFERHIKLTFQNQHLCSTSSSKSVNTIPKSISNSSQNTSASSTSNLSNLITTLVSDSEIVNNNINTVISNKMVDTVIHDDTLIHENSITNPIQNNKSILTDKLRFIISKYHVSHHFVNELLTILREEELDVPKDVRTLLKSPKSHSHNILNINPGTYIHFGVRNMLSPIISKFFDELHNTYLLELGCNIDGLPISRSSKACF
ncbi:hypothetical protein ACI65C_004357 [Semiaphis heraclei]